MYKKILINLFFLLFSNIASTQIGLQLNAVSSTIVVKKQIIEPTKVKYPTLQEIFSSSNPITQTPKVYCYDDLAFFCKIEVELEKTNQLPIKFRLGDVDYVDWLEGKNNYLIK